jgi:hypothetical protein
MMWWVGFCDREIEMLCWDFLGGSQHPCFALGIFHIEAVLNYVTSSESIL